MGKNELYSFVDRFLLHRLELVNAFKVELSPELLELDLTFPHVLILRSMFMKKDKTAQMASLANEMQISPAMTTHLVDRLENRGLVQRRRDLRDRRVVNVSLTNRGEDLVLRFRQVEKERVVAFLEGLCPDERQQFMASVTTLMEILGRGAQGCFSTYGMK